MKAHVLKKREGRKIAICFKIISYRESHIYKRSIVLVYLFPHTFTSWSKSMALLSLDPRFDFTTYAIQVCYFVYPNLKLHINLFRSRRKQKKAKHCYALVRIYTPLFESAILRSTKWTRLFLEKKFKNSKLLRCGIGEMTLFQELFRFSTTQGNMLANATNPTCVKSVLE
jgi:hypothetical protein